MLLLGQTSSTPLGTELLIFHEGGKQIHLLRETSTQKLYLLAIDFFPNRPVKRYYPHFTNEGTKARRVSASCSRKQSIEVAQPGSKPRGQYHSRY